MLDIEALYNANCSCVYWTAYGILRDGDKAKDAAQEVFFKALKHQATLRRLTQLQRKLWLCTAARNECIDTLRKLKREYLIDPQFLHVPEDELRLPDNLLLRKEEHDAVFALLDALPDKYRTPLFLYYFAEIPQKEIAAILGINDSTLRSLLKRAKAQLCKAITEGGLRDE